MHGTLPHSSPIAELGSRIFRKMGSHRPSAFSLSKITNALMQWSIRDEHFKVNLFRLVDVLPQLRSAADVARHVRQYLRDDLSRVGSFGSPLLASLIRWGVDAPPHSLRAKLIAAQVKLSVEHMARSFIAGETPEAALVPLRRLRHQGLAFTVDLLGEFCLSEPEADAYMQRYVDALQVIGAASRVWPERHALVAQHPGEASPLCVSVKLTALYSQCHLLNEARSVSILSERLGVIVREARRHQAQVYVDAEDTANNPIIYQVFERVFGSREFRDVAYPGIVVQAYAKGAPSLIQRLLQFAEHRGAPIAVRLVKGAYWDQETTLAAQNNWPSPLYAHKQSSDACFEHLSRVLLDNSALVLPAIGSHNIRSLAHACTYAELVGVPKSGLELQVLYGMAEPIATAFSSEGYLVRVYAPIGDRLIGMGYLVRRLLENTSNESFLRHTFFDGSDLSRLLAEPTYHPQDLMRE
jgi:RHH-type proline utilization regulon transcriptional repressor/proline dehydrogenase/delta 1-pyrroline-5-carboxylate dehydrogenase